MLKPGARRKLVVCGHAEEFTFLLDSHRGLPVTASFGGDLGDVFEAGGYNPLLCFTTAMHRWGCTLEVAQLWAYNFLSILPKIEYPCKDAYTLGHLGLWDRAKAVVWMYLSGASHWQCGHSSPGARLFCRRIVVCSLRPQDMSLKFWI